MKTFIIEIEDEDYEFYKKLFELLKLDAMELFIPPPPNTDIKT